MHCISRYYIHIYISGEGRRGSLNWNAVWCFWRLKLGPRLRWSRIPIPFHSSKSYLTDRAQVTGIFGRHVSGMKWCGVTFTTTSSVVHSLSRSFVRVTIPLIPNEEWGRIANVRSMMCVCFGVVCFKYLLVVPPLQHGEYYRLFQVE